MSITINDPLLEPTFGKDVEGDEEMALSEVGTEDQDLGDILEK